MRRAVLFHKEERFIFFFAIWCKEKLAIVGRGVGANRHFILGDLSLFARAIYRRENITFAEGASISNDIIAYIQAAPPTRETCIRPGIFERERERVVVLERERAMK